MKRNQVTALDVARHAGVSRAAVSRTFTPGASVSAKTRAQVLKAAEALGYQVNHLAKSLNSASSGIVALIASEIETPHRAEVLSVMTKEFQAAGKITILINTSGTDESVRDALMQAIRFRTEAAIVLSGSPDRSIAEVCQSNGVKLVLINRTDNIPNTLHILPDNKSVGETALNALINSGCKSVAIANSETATLSLLERERAFLNAAYKREIPVTRCVLGSTSYETGQEIGSELLSGTQRPDGVFCTTDLLAFGVMDIARHKLGLRIPEELAVVGFDNVAQAGWESYKLTTFKQPVEKIAKASLDWTTEESGESAIATIPVRMVWRNSTK